MKYLMVTFLILLALPYSGAAQPGTTAARLLDSAWQALEREDFPKAKRLARLALGDANDEMRKAECYRAIGRAEEEMHNLVEAYRNYRLALSISEQQKDAAGVAKVSRDMAILKDAEGDYALARNFARRAVRAFEALADTLALADALVDLANPNKSLGDFNQALQHFRRADTLYRQMQDSLGMAISSYGMGDAYYQLEHYAEARPYILASIPVFQREKEHAKVAMAYNVLASIDVAEGRREEAKAHYRASMNWAEKANVPLLAFDASLNLAEMEAENRNAQQARALFEVASQALGRNGSSLDQASLQKMAASLDALEQEIENQRLLAWLVFVLAVSLALGAFAFWRDRKRNGRLLALQQQMMKRQHEVKALMDEIQLTNERARLEGEKRERKKITKTLHDTVGSQLAATRWLQEANIEALKNGTLSDEAMQNVLNMMSEAYKNARNVERLLDKHTIDWLEEIGGFFRALSEKSQLDIRYSTAGLEGRLDWELGLFVYKMVLTLTANVLLHAGASRLIARVGREEGILSILIEDDGVGFDRDDVRQGSGLKNVEEYVSQLKGEVKITPRPGGGTAVAIEIPVSKN